MGATSIEWADFTFNPWIGCQKVSAGCANCYAERFGKRIGVKWGPAGERRRTSAAYWRQPLAWNRKAEREGVRRRVFCASLADVFEDRPGLEAWRFDVFALAALTPWLDWLFLTKRPDFMVGCVSDTLWWAMVEGSAQRMEFERTGVDPSLWLAVHGPLPNVWLGTSVEDQATADQRIPHLLAAPAAVRFLSCEPLLGPVDLRWCEWCGAFGSHECESSDEAVIDWVIAGGESGPGARPMHPAWARSLRDQCQAAGVPFHFKQWGEWSPERPPHFCKLSKNRWSHETFAWDKTGKVYNPFNPPADHYPDVMVYRVGKHAAGRLLDGREWNEMPEVRR